MRRSRQGRDLRICQRYSTAALLARMNANEIARRIAAEVMWAPSVHNTQPWLLEAGPRHISLYADTTRHLAVADPEGRELMISCGAALFTIRLVLRSLGFLPVARVLPDPAAPDLVARVTWSPGPRADEYEQLLSGQVRKRRSHRGGFDLRPLPDGLLTTLQQGAARDGAAFRVLTDDGRRATLAAAVQEAERCCRLDGARIGELARWAPAPGSISGDGVPSTSYPARDDRTVPWFPGRDFARGHGWGLPPLATASAARTAGAVALLTTGQDQPSNWVSAGQALQRMLLAATACGVAVALHSQPLELPWLREAIRRELSDGAYPQLVLRLGVVMQVGLGVRRNPADILVLTRQATRFLPCSVGRDTPSSLVPGLVTALSGFGLEAGQPRYDRFASRGGGIL